MVKAREIKREDLPYKETESEWDDYLDGIMAGSWGLTPEELKEFDQLETEKERSEFMKLHSKKE